MEREKKAKIIQALLITVIDAMQNYSISQLLC